MGMHTYYELKDMLCRELDEVTRKGELSPGSLDIVDKLTHSIKSLATIIAMDEAQEQGSYDEGTSGWYPMPMRFGGRSYEGGSNASMRGGRSGRRGRDSMGRYTSRESYRGRSRDEERDMVIKDLVDIMGDVKDEETRMKFKRFIDDMETM